MDKFCPHCCEKKVHINEDVLTVHTFVDGIVDNLSTLFFRVYWRLYWQCLFCKAFRDWCNLSYPTINVSQTFGFESVSTCCNGYQGFVGTKRDTSATRSGLLFNGWLVQQQYVISVWFKFLLSARTIAATYRPLPPAPPQQSIKY